MAHDMADQHFWSYEEVKNRIYSWIIPNKEQSSRQRFRTLCKRLEKIVAENAQHTELYMYSVVSTV